MNPNDADPDDSRVRKRLDQLLASAIEEQEREQQGFMKVLQASRDALTAVRAELDLLRHVVEGREQAVADLLDQRLAMAAREDTMQSLQQRIELLEGEQASLKKALSVKLDAIGRTLEAVEWRTQEGMAALANRVGEMETSFSEHAVSVVERLDKVDRRDEDLTAATEAALKELGDGIEGRQQEVAEAILKALDPVGRIMQLVQSRLARAASELAVAQGSLFARLAEREDRLERQRDLILSDLLDEFAGVVKSRDRHRIGAGLREAEENRKQRRDAGRNRRHDDPPPTSYDGYGVGAVAAAPLPGDVALPPGLPPDPVPAPDAPRGRRGRKPAL